MPLPALSPAVVKRDYDPIFYCCFVLWTWEELNKLEHVEAITQPERQFLFRTSNPGQLRKNIYCCLKSPSAKMWTRRPFPPPFPERGSGVGWRSPGFSLCSGRCSCSGAALRAAGRRVEPRLWPTSAALQSGRDAGRRCRAPQFHGAPWRQHGAWPRTAEGGVTCPSLEVGRTKCCYRGERGEGVVVGAARSVQMASLRVAMEDERKSRAASWPPLRAVIVFLLILPPCLFLCGQGE